MDKKTNGAEAGRPLGCGEGYEKMVEELTLEPQGCRMAVSRKEGQQTAVVILLSGSPPTRTARL